MKENTQEKNLIEKKEKSVFGRIKNFFRKFFNKKEEIVEDKTDDVGIKTNENNNDFKEYIKITEDEETKLLDLQRRYRRGEIGEKDLTDEQIKSLCALYDKQIVEIQKTIDAKSQELAEYKRRKQQRIEKKNA